MDIRDDIPHMRDSVHISTGSPRRSTGLNQPIQPKESRCFYNSSLPDMHSTLRLRWGTGHTLTTTCNIACVSSSQLAWDRHLHLPTIGVFENDGSWVFDGKHETRATLHNAHVITRCRGSLGLPCDDVTKGGQGILELENFRANLELYILTIGLI